jgi:hypothetical protein
VWHPVHHLPEPPQRVEAEVPKPGVPQPWLLRALRRQAHRLLDLQVEQVQPVARTPHLGKQAALLVANEEDPILDLDLAPVFIQLPQANDAGAQPWDVIHIRQRSVLTVQTPKEDGSPPADLHA